MRSEELLNPRDAAHALGISYPTVKQWIYKKKLRSVQTAGGHHRIPASEIERFLPRTNEKDALAGRRGFRPARLFRWCAAETAQFQTRECGDALRRFARCAVSSCRSTA